MSANNWLMGFCFKLLPAAASSFKDEIYHGLQCFVSPSLWNGKFH